MVWGIVEPLAAFLAKVHVAVFLYRLAYGNHDFVCWKWGIRDGKVSSILSGVSARIP